MSGFNLPLGKASMSVWVRPLALASFVGLAAVGTALVRKKAKLSTKEALGWGLAASATHYQAILVHYAGHAVAARQTGYPMKGVLIHSILGTSIYPKDEGELPAAVHIRRALGGPIASVAYAAALTMLQYQMAPSKLRNLVRLMALNNVLTFGVGAMLPLGFTDGSSILHWLGELEQTR